MGHLGNRGTAKQHHRAFEQRRRCGLLGCRYSPALPALLSDATPNRGLRVLCVFIVLIASSDAALAAGSMDEDDGDHDDHVTGDSEQDEQQQQAQKPRKRPCALPTGQLTDKPTNRPTEPNSNQRQRHNPNQQQPEGGVPYTRPSRIYVGLTARFTLGLRSVRRRSYVPVSLGSRPV